MRKYNNKCGYCGKIFQSESPKKGYCNISHKTRAKNLRKQSNTTNNSTDTKNTDDFHIVDKIRLMKIDQKYRFLTHLGETAVGNYVVSLPELHLLDGVVIKVKSNGFLISGHYVTDSENEKITYVFDDGELIIGSSRRQIEDYLNG